MSSTHSNIANKPSTIHNPIKTPGIPLKTSFRTRYTL